MRFELLPSVRHVVPGDFVPILACSNRSAVARITEEHGANRSVSPLNPENRHLVIDWPIRVITKHDAVALINAAVHRKSGPADPLFQHCRLTVLECRLNNLYEPGLQ